MAFLLQDGFQIRLNLHTVHVAGKVLLRSLQSSLRVLPSSSIQVQIYPFGMIFGMEISPFYRNFHYFIRSTRGGKNLLLPTLLSTPPTPLGRLILVEY
ncbi:hypothetical protein BVC80_8751g22 [Macleaya cordata]|uniref:Uncharacterized protein n=1 Tax=Macleaya cordata TaxID=56857 RepID=A0A200QKB9_MACCD|nr:hypothetical protein BVC80_8751g22 [Macleaya cordata]